MKSYPFVFCFVLSSVVLGSLLSTMPDSVGALLVFIAALLGWVISFGGLCAMIPEDIRDRRLEAGSKTLEDLHIEPEPLTTIEETELWGRDEKELLRDDARFAPPWMK
jgi:hypothetical protein